MAKTKKKAAPKKPIRSSKKAEKPNAYALVDAITSLTVSIGMASAELRAVKFGLENLKDTLDRLDARIVVSDLEEGEPDDITLYDEPGYRTEKK